MTGTRVEAGQEGGAGRGPGRGAGREVGAGGETPGAGGKLLPPTVLLVFHTSTL